MATLAHLLSFGFALALSLPLAAKNECRSVEAIRATYPGEPARYWIVTPCFTATGQVQAIAQETPDQGGEYHVVLWAEVGDGKGWVDTEFVGADQSQLPAVADWRLEHATITGALVEDHKYGRLAIKPAWKLHGEPYLRQYNEKLPSGAWQQVTQWLDGSYTARAILPSEYQAANITR